MKNLFLAGMLLLSAHVYAQPSVNSSLFSILEARALGPGTTSGRISAIEGVNQDEGKTIYVGTAGGGIWKSTNAGASYKPIFDKYCQSIGALCIDQQNPETLYAGTGESNMRNSVSIGNGLYRSTDGGDNWKKIGLDSTEHISRIIIHPKNSDTVYVAVPGALWSDSQNRGLYQSTDGGNTWKRILFTNAQSGCADVLIDPQHPEIIWASMWQFRRTPYSFNSGGAGSGLFKSIDGGKSWKEITQGMPPKPFGRIAMTLAPSNPKKMIAIIEAKETGLYISDDGGESWKSQSASMNVCARPFYFSTIAIDPQDEKRVYRPAFEFAYSDDGGYSFSGASGDGGWVHSDMHALWINPAHPRILYLGTDGGVYTSIDRGVTWQFQQGLPVGQFYHVSYDNKKPYSVYGGLQDNGSWMVPSSAPGGIGNGNWSRLAGGDGFWVQADIDGKTAYAESQGGNMMRINLRNAKGENIQPVNTIAEDKLRWNWNTPIVLGANNPHHLYTGAQYLYRSTDQGRNWTKISPDLTTNDKAKQKQEESGGLSADNTSAENHCTIFTITESAHDENQIWVGTDDGNLQMTQDAGKHWTNLRSNLSRCGIPAGAWVSSIYVSNSQANTVYVTCENHMYGDHQTYLAKSTDLGQTWQRIQNKDFTGFAHKIIEDPKNPNVLFLGTEMGLFCSLDAGTNWFRMKNKIPEYALVRDICIHPETHDLIVATHGRGIYILDNISVLSDLNDEILHQDVYLFPTQDMVLNDGNLGWGGPEVSGGWGCGNAQERPSIQYYLKDRVNGKANIDILNEQGELIQTIPATVRRGINRVDWNLRSIPPKVAEGSTKMDGAGFTAPMVLPGKYTIKLSIKDQIFTGSVRCVHDSTNADMTEFDRRLVYDKAMELQSMYKQLAVLIDSITRLQKQLKSDSIVYKKSKQNQQYFAELEKIRSELLATKQTSMFADEEKLREKLSSLYGTFCSMESRPNTLQLKAIEDLKTELQTQIKAFNQVSAPLRGSGIY